MIAQSIMIMGVGSYCKSLKEVILLTKKHKQFESAAIHDGYDSGDMSGSLIPPIFQTSTYTFDTAEQGERRFAGEEEGYVYSRLGNPTVTVLEERIASLENVERGLAFGSGMAAIPAILIALTKANDHMICSAGLYGCTFGLVKMFEEKYNITHDYSMMETKEELRSLIKPETTCIYLETQIKIGRPH